MKKTIFSFVIVAAGLLTTSCGNNKSNGADGKDSTAVAAEETPKGFTTYTNEQMGYSVNIPDWMTRHDPTVGAESGTIFVSDPNSFDAIRIETSGDNNGNLGDPWTAESVKKRFESEKEMGGKGEFVEEECGDNYYYYKRKSEDGEAITTQKAVFSGMKRASVVIYYDNKDAERIGGDVAKQIMKSLKIK